MCYGIRSPENDFQNYRPITPIVQALFLWEFQWENGPILNIMAENDSNVIDLVLTHLTHPWGPP